MDEKMQNHPSEKTMDGKFIPMTSLMSGFSQQVAEGVSFHTIQIVNIVFMETDDGFILIDTGMPNSSEKIVDAIDKQFGNGAVPRAIVLTHGHFDHVGTVNDLVEKWNIPVYAHSLEIPYLTGKKNYPEPDGTVEGGLIAKMSPMFPNEGIDLGTHVKALPDDGSIPVSPEWKWIHTPGHAPGHISLFRESDRTLIAGDAFVTVRQDSLYKVLVQKQEINGPPRYFTTDWQAAWNSVKKLAALEPEVAITGHGLPISGEELRTGLHQLANNFPQIAIPDYGKFIQ